MPIPDDVEELIARLAGPLSPPAREGFRRAAEDALTRIPCLGEGAAYRAVSVLQRAFFTPPIDLPRRPTFQPGDRVRVRQGPFAGHLALFVGMRPPQRVEILLALLGGHQRVELASEDVEVV